jgi:hypothetical protein
MSCQHLPRTLFLPVWWILLPCAVLSQTKPHGQTDTVSGPTLSVSLTADDYPKLNSLHCDETKLENGQPLMWAEHSPLFDLGTLAYNRTGTTTATCTATNYVADKSRAVIFHFVHWSVLAPVVSPAVAPANIPPPQLKSSVWYVYRYPRSSKDNVLVPAGITGTGDPLIYGAKHLLIITVDVPDHPVLPNALQSTLSAPVTQGTSDLSSDISALFSALTNISAGNVVPMAGLGAPKAKQTVLIAVTCEDGTAKLPFSVQVADAAAIPLAGGGPVAMALAGGPAGGAGQNSGATSTTASGAVSCTGIGNTLPCTMGRTFTSKEHAYIDISAGLAVPGVRDTSYTFSSTSTPPAASSSVTRHTDAYALIDIFPLGALLPKESPAPHINFGIPVTSQSLHRPYLGLSENLTGWTHLQKSLSLPLAINVFGGVVFMKTEQLIGTPTTSADYNNSLSWHWVHKFMFGIEVPISSVTSKFSKGGSSKGS